MIIIKLNEVKLMSYAIEKLNTIYYKLAVGEGDIKQRLISVEIELLCITKPDIRSSGRMGTDN